MAIQGPWVGTSAVAQTGQRWGQDQRLAVRLPREGWYSDLIGRSMEVVIEINAEWNYNKDWVIASLRNAGSAPVVLNIRGDIVSYSAGVPVLEFPWDLQNEYITINNFASIWGRGGNGGGQNGFWPSNGGPAISNYIGRRLRINNGGNIGGGGGGGGCAYQAASAQAAVGGGGGCPLGIGGASYIGAQHNGVNATISSQGNAGASYYSSDRAVHGGAGAWYAGQAGSASGNINGYAYTQGAAGGAALVGEAPTWINLGAVYGAYLA